MTPKKQKQLAEFAAEFLGYHKDDSSFYWLGELSGRDAGQGLGSPLAIDELVYELFESEQTAPILAYLAKREMEKRGYWWRAEYEDGIEPPEAQEDRYGYFFTKIVSAKAHEWNNLIIWNNNEYIALWSAIFEAVRQEKG